MEKHIIEVQRMGKKNETERKETVTVTCTVCFLTIKLQFEFDDVKINFVYLEGVATLSVSKHLSDHRPVNILFSSN